MKELMEDEKITTEIKYFRHLSFKVPEIMT